MWLNDSFYYLSINLCLFSSFVVLIGAFQMENTDSIGHQYIHLESEVRNLKLAYGDYISELRDQAASIKTLEDLVKVQANAITELQADVRQQEKEVGVLREILMRLNVTNSSLSENPHFGDDMSITSTYYSDIARRSQGFGRTGYSNDSRTNKPPQKPSRRNRNRSKVRNHSGVRLNKTDVVHSDASAQLNPGCIFDLHASSPQYPPLFFDENNNVIHPTLQGKTRIVTLSADEQIKVGCLGGIRQNKPTGNNLKATGSQVNSAVCTINSTLLVNEREFNYTQLGCTEQNKEILKEGNSCANGRGTVVHIGWQLGSDFVPLYDTCHDKNTTANYFSTHVIVGRSVDADDKANERPSFRQAGYYPGVDVNAAFSQANQNKTIERLVGSFALAAKYFNPKQSFFLARGHLAPDGDFIDAASQDASYYYLNMAPQWQSFNGGNWNVLEAAVRQIAIARDIDLTIHTGTYGTMNLADVNGKQRPFYLAQDKNNNGVVPVPKYFWKLIHDPSSETATAVIGINNPHLERITSSDILCPDVCNQVSWIATLRWKPHDFSKGYMFCCTAQSLHKAVSYAPDLDLPLFL